MNIHFKMSQLLRQEVLTRLFLPHSFAHERVGFLSCRVAATVNGMLVLAGDFHPVRDTDYLEDHSVGAMMGPAAIRKALQLAYNNACSMFHVHCHEHKGRPGFSGTDFRETAQFVPDFFNVQPALPHGALILSTDSAVGLCWTGQTNLPLPLAKISFVGEVLKLI
jgi:hypothetical protein